MVKKMDIAKIIDGKKFMWDGETYPDKKTAQEVITNYEKEKFETRLIKEGDEYFIFSRRIVTEIVIDGQ